MTIADKLVETFDCVEATRSEIARYGGDAPPGTGLRDLPKSFGGIAALPPWDWPNLAQGMPANSLRALVKISPDPNDNWVALSCTASGGFSVDWGDGTSYTGASNSVAEHQYSWDPDGYVCSEGYQFAVLTMTGIGEISYNNLTLLPAAWSARQGGPSIFLDLHYNTPLATSNRLGQASLAIRHTQLRRVSGAMGTPTGTSWNSLFRGCTSLTEVPALDWSGATNIFEVFAYCASLRRVPPMDTSNCVTVQNLFFSCASLTELPNNNLSVATNLSAYAGRCSALREPPDIIAPVATTVSNIFTACTSLEALPDRFEVGGTTSANTDSMWGTVALTTVPTTSFIIKTSFSVTMSCLSESELNRMFTMLPTANAGTQTISISSTPGAATCNRSIATAKGWTVTG